jgi:AmmeMemoRadiSam system protein B
MDLHHGEVRDAAVAGMFYEGRAARLRAEVEGYVARPARPPRSARGVMVPHAGYVFSGAMCGRALASVQVPKSVLILHTKHHPGGGALSLATFERWRTPLGEVPADAALNAALANVPGLTPSNAPHHQEHAAEVVLPFLQVLRPDVEVAVISVGPAPGAVLQQVGEAIAERLQGRDVLVVASSDMNHYEDHETTLQKDELALAELARFSPERMLDVCERHQISMCGAAATALMLFIARAQGATEVELLEHDTSYAASGDFQRTVGYASARVL